MKYARIIFLCNITIAPVNEILNLQTPLTLQSVAHKLQDFCGHDTTCFQRHGQHLCAIGVVKH